MQLRGGAADGLARQDDQAVEGGGRWRVCRGVHAGRGVGEGGERRGEDAARCAHPTPPARPQAGGHTDFVSALAYMPPSVCDALPNGGVVSGSRDASVVLWDLQSAAPVQQLRGHAYQVSAVLVTPQGDVVSASLDKTVRVWRGGQCVQTLEGHEAAVLCLLQLPNGDVLSGSGDCTIRVWRDGECAHVIRAHSDSVR